MIAFRTYGVAALQSKVAAAVLLAWASVAQAAPVEIVALGDSLTQGYGLPRGEGFVPQMQSWLRERGHDVELVNAGVSGDTTAGGLARADWSIEDDTDAMIVALGGNDLLRGIDPASSRRNLDAILKIAANRDVPVLLVGLRARATSGRSSRRRSTRCIRTLPGNTARSISLISFKGLPATAAHPPTCAPSCRQTKSIPTRTA